MQTSKILTLRCLKFDLRKTSLEKYDKPDWKKKKSEYLTLMFSIKADSEELHLVYFAAIQSNFSIFKLHLKTHGQMQ